MRQDSDFLNELAAPQTGNSNVKIHGAVYVLPKFSSTENVLLYGEPHPDDKAILETAEDGLRICPGLVLIAGESWGSVDSRKLLPRGSERKWDKFLDQRGGASVECKGPL
jgi:hypothetical protein